MWNKIFTFISNGWMRNKWVTLNTQVVKPASELVDLTFTNFSGFVSKVLALNLSFNFSVSRAVCGTEVGTQSVFAEWQNIGS